MRGKAEEHQERGGGRRGSRLGEVGSRRGRRRRGTERMSKPIGGGGKEMRVW